MPTCQVLLLGELQQDAPVELAGDHRNVFKAFETWRSRYGSRQLCLPGHESLFRSGTQMYFGKNSDQ
jgi:hypothetical protein